MEKKVLKQPTHQPNLLALRRHYTNPHPFYDALRTHNSLSFDESSQSWLATGHAVTVSILSDPRFLSSSGLTTRTTGTTSPHLATVSRQLLFLDGERHRAAQHVMLRPLAQMTQSLPPVIEKIAQRALSSVRERGEIEIVSEFAAPISLLTIAHVLGLPTEDQDTLQQLERWSDTLGDITSGYVRGNIQNCYQEIKMLEDYFRAFVQKKRHHLSDDFLSSLIRASDIFPEEDDLIANCMMIFAAGRITTKKLLGNGANWLLSQWELHQAEAQANLQVVKRLGEELLRMVTPTRYLIREAREDVTLLAASSQCHYIQQGQRVLLFLEAANYDPTLFVSPLTFDPHRHPNKHLAFGYGPHQCPGATLARAEIQVALRELLTLPGVCLKPGSSPAWNSNPNLGGFTSNPLVFQPLLV